VKPTDRNDEFGLSATFYESINNYFARDNPFYFSGISGRIIRDDGKVFQAFTKHEVTTG
jgi:hypothetical protein